jgi:proline racemase
VTPGPRPATTLAAALLDLPAPGRAGHPLACVDSHTCGQPTRVVLGGWPEAPGEDAAAARERLRGEGDWVRRRCTLEPRGRRSMFGAVVLPPARPDCARSVVFMDVDGYPDMCGHATIGVATTLATLGLVTEERFALDTPAGVVTVRVDGEPGRATAVTFENRPARFAERLEAAGIGVDRGWGGQWYAFAAAADAGLEIVADRIDELVAGAAELRRACPAIGNVVWTGPPQTPGAHARNIAIAPSGAFDRSPCGTATSARMAVLHARGALATGTPFVNESILGTRYVGKVVGETELDGGPAIVPEVTGQAWLTSASVLWADPDDPLRDGFLV